MRAVIFDMDGLMIDSERLYFQVEREMAASFGRQVQDKTLRRMMGRNPLECMRIFVEDLGLEISAEEALALRDQRMLQKMSEDLQPMPGLLETIQRLSASLELAIATGAQQMFLDLVVDQLQIRPFFAVLQSSDNITEGKPHPEIYQQVAAQLQLPESQCVVLEDSSNGALAAKRAGCYVIAVPNEYSQGEDFHFVDALVADLHEAGQHILQLPQT